MRTKTRKKRKQGTANDLSQKAIYESTKTNSREFETSRKTNPLKPSHLLLWKKASSSHLPLQPLTPSCRSPHLPLSALHVHRQPAAPARGPPPDVNKLTASAQRSPSAQAFTAASRLTVSRLTFVAPRSDTETVGSHRVGCDRVPRKGEIQIKKRSMVTMVYIEKSRNALGASLLWRVI